MNRAERRKKQSGISKRTAHNAFMAGAAAMNHAEKEIIEFATYSALKELVLLAAFTIQDKYGNYMKKEVGGKCRAQRFVVDIMHNIDAMASGYVTIDDMKQTLQDETGWIPIIEETKNEIKVEV